MGSDRILVPGNLQTQQILLEPSLREKNQYLKVLCFTPAIIKLITGLVFASDVPMQKMLEIIKENNQDMPQTGESDYNLFADAELKDFADCLEEC